MDPLGFGVTDGLAELEERFRKRENLFAEGALAAAAAFGFLSGKGAPLPLRAAALGAFAFCTGASLYYSKRRSDLLKDYEERINTIFPEPDGFLKAGDGWALVWFSKG